MSLTGPAGSADAPLASDNVNPAAPNTGRVLLRRFRFEASFSDMGSPPGQGSTNRFGRVDTKKTSAFIGIDRYCQKIPKNWDSSISNGYGPCGSAACRPWA